MVGVPYMPNPYDPVSQIMGCIPNLSMSIVTAVEHITASPRSIIATFRTEQNAKDFMFAAHSLPERFHNCQFLWADNPASPIAPPSPSNSLPLAGSFVDNRRG